MSQLYRSFIEKYPISTKAVTSGLLFSIGDAITQCSTHSMTKLSMKDHLIGSGILIFSLLDSGILRLFFTVGTAKSSLKFRRPSLAMWVKV
jgi:hypothetical protein